MARAGAGLSRASVEELSSRLGEPSWALESRLEAWEAFERLPPPSVTHPERWRRTDLGGLDLGALALPDGTALPDPPQHLGPLLRDPEARAGLIVHMNGKEPLAELEAPASGRGVILCGLSEALKTHQDLVSEHLLGAFDRPPTHRFEALRAALWSGGTFLYVPSGVEVALPLLSHRWLGAAGIAAFPRTLLVAEEGSGVTLVELCTSVAAGRRGLISGDTEIVARPGARVRHAVVQEWGQPLWEVGSRIRAGIGRDASFSSLVATLGGGVAKSEIESRLLGPGASAEMLGVYFGSGAQHVELHTLQHHGARSTRSDLSYKGAVKDSARGLFSGLIRVEEGAQGTDAFQSNRNLILSEGARTESTPMLEIMANDLRCSHGSATSRLDEEQILYLMSRGIRRKRAAFMIVEGFFADILDRIPEGRLRAYLRARIAEKMI